MTSDACYTVVGSMRRLQQLWVPLKSVWVSLCHNNHGSMIPDQSVVCLNLHYLSQCMTHTQTWYNMNTLILNNHNSTEANGWKSRAGLPSTMIEVHSLWIGQMNVTKWRRPGERWWYCVIYCNVLYTCIYRVVKINYGSFLSKKPVHHKRIKGAVQWIERQFSHQCRICSWGFTREIPVW